MSDDHAKKAVSSYNKTLIETPNIDRLAREGIRFDNAFDLKLKPSDEKDENTGGNKGFDARPV